MRDESVLIGGAEESGAKQEKWPFRQKNLVFSVAFGLVVDVADTLCVSLAEKAQSELI